MTSIDTSPKNEAALPTPGALLLPGIHSSQYLVLWGENPRYLATSHSGYTGVRGSPSRFAKAECAIGVTLLSLQASRFRKDAAIL
ncbi:MAG: hypothetical protein E3J25_03835 [Anaerolineales bacterium]|nr:MAG: hypothetical protein E3J25_03835 [Anaerolineales bacterium]